MPKTFLPLVVILALAGSVLTGQAAKTNPRALKLALDSTAGIEAANGKLDVVNYRGRRALRSDHRGAPARPESRAQATAQALATIMMTLLVLIAGRVEKPEY